MKLETKDYKHFHIGNISFDDYHQANRCLNGDEVEWDGSKCILQTRAHHRPLVGILELNSKYLYGHTSRGSKIYLFHPLDTSYPPMRVGCSEKDTSRHQIALVNFDTWTESIPRGNLVRLLGPIGTLDAERVALQWLYGKPELQKFTLDCLPAYVERKLIQGNTINIDPDGCQDIDDAITLIPEKDGWKLIITIADVAETVQPASPVDELASRKGQTLYQNGNAVLPMLPSFLSEGSLSLLPGQKRLGVALVCLWSQKKLHIEGFEEILLQNTASYTYESILTANFPISVLKEIASFLKGEETDDSHEWVEQLMLLYNKEGAKKLVEAKAGLVRTHKEAQKEVLEQMEALHPDLRSLAFASAKYEWAEEGKVHATLGNQAYTHLTSPLRRYADLVNQRVLKAILRGEPLPILPSTLPEELNTTQKLLKHHDRELFFLQQILKEPTGCVEGIVVAETKVYCPSWKRIVKIAQLPEVGTNVTVEYFADLKKTSWKDRIVFQLKN